MVIGRPEIRKERPPGQEKTRMFEKNGRNALYT